MRSFYFCICAIIYLLVLSACTRPSVKVIPSDASRCIYCAGTGKVPNKIRALTFYIDCTNCGGRGYNYNFIPKPHPEEEPGMEDKENIQKSKRNNPEVYYPVYEPRQIWVNCFDCNGTKICSYCNGDGWDISTRSDGSFNSVYKCPVCNGVGKCTHCSGTGGHYEMQSVRVR